MHNCIIAFHYGIGSIQVIITFLLFPNYFPPAIDDLTMCKYYWPIVG